MISLAGKAALVTGGSRGIGATTVRMFAQAGADVVFTYHRNREAAGHVEQESRKHGTRVESCKADVRKTADTKKAVDSALERLGRLDIVVANAGAFNADGAPIEKLTEREWDEMMLVNLKSVYALVQAVAPGMIAQRSGRIIAISSTAAQRGAPLHSAYSAAKGGVISFIKAVAGELAQYNVLVNCIAAGFTQTEMSAPLVANKAGQKMVLGMIPLGRMATPEEIAGPVLFAASDLATFMTGEVINVNGGSFRCG